MPPTSPERREYVPSHHDIAPGARAAAPPSARADPDLITAEEIGQSLRQLMPSAVVFVRYYSPGEAQARFGPGHLLGAIEVTTLRR